MALSLDARSSTDNAIGSAAADTLAAPRALLARAGHPLRRWHDGGSPISYGYQPLSIPGDSAAVTKYRPDGIENPHVVAAIATVCSVVFLGLAAYSIVKLVQRHQRAREEADADAAFQALEKGMGNGSSPPMELSAPSLWGKGLSFFQSERKRGPWTSVAETDEGKRELSPPRPALLRERSDVSLDDSVKSGKSGDSSVSSGSNSDRGGGGGGGHHVVDQFGAVNRLPRNKPGFQRKRSKLRIVQHDLDHVAEEEEDASGGPYPSSPLSPSTHSSASSTMGPASASGSTSSHRNSPTSPNSSAFKSLQPPSPPHLHNYHRPTVVPVAPQPEPVPTGLRPLSLTPSYSDMSIVSAYTVSTPSGATSATASPSPSTSRLRPAPEDDLFRSAAEARDANDEALVGLERRADGSF